MTSASAEFLVKNRIKKAGKRILYAEKRIQKAAQRILFAAKRIKKAAQRIQKATVLNGDNERLLQTG